MFEQKHHGILEGPFREDPEILDQSCPVFLVSPTQPDRAGEKYQPHDGKASLSTAGGNIDLGAAKGHVDAKTAGGELNLKNIVGSVNGKTAGGNIDVELNPIGAGSSSLATAGGDITLFLPADAKATISARIRGDDSRGDEPPEYEILSDFGPVTLEEGGRRGELRATLKINGGGTPIRLETSEGNISVKKGAK